MTVWVIAMGMIHLEAQPLTSVTINGLTVPLTVVSNYAPVVGLHTWEEYLPCSIDYILAHAAVEFGQPSDYAADLSDGVVVKKHPSQTDLYDYALSDPGGTNYFLSIEAAARPGGPPTNTAPPYDSSVLTNVPMYVSVQVPADRSFVDINFYFLYAYNGPQTIRGLEPSRHFNAVLPNFAEHEGDIEGISVRITPDFKKVVFVRYEAHGNSSYYAPSEVPFEGSHPIVWCGLYSHSSYNPMGLNVNDWIDLQDIGGLAEVVDIVNASIMWRPYNYNNLVLVGLNTNNVPINNQWWAAFAGRIGVHQLNTFQEADGVGGDLDPDQFAWAESCGEAAEAHFQYLFAQNNYLKYDVDNVGVGPQGLGARASIIENQPSYSIPQISGELFSGAGNNLVLSVNPANTNGPLLMATYDPKLPAAQQWQRQEWDSSAAPRYIYINQLSGLIMTANGTQGGTVTQTNALVTSDFWMLGGDQGNDFHAIQWASDATQNLNVPGDGPYNAGRSVVTFSWGGGAPNEIWKFVVPHAVPTAGRLEAAATYNGTNLYLSVDPNNPGGQLVVEPFATNSAQIWLQAANASSSTATNYTYVNQLTGLMMYAPGGNGAIVSQTNLLSPDTDWYYGTDEGNGYHAIQFGPDNGQNLNIPGDGPYPFGTGVITFGWGGGAPNEIWRFLAAHPPVQQPCLIESQLQYNGVNLVLSANPTNGTGPVVLEPYSPGQTRQVWLQNTFPRVGGNSYAYINEASGLALYAPDIKGAAATVTNFDVNNNDLFWNVANPFTVSWNALQFAPDENQNLNVFGNYSAYPGAVAGLWTWSGGASNEVWQIIADTQPPKISLPGTLTVPTDPGQSNAVVNYQVTASDNFGVVNLSCTPPAGAAFPIGTNYVNCTASDPSGNYASNYFAIIVRDTEPPSVFCPTNITVPTDPGQTNAVVYFAALAFDNSGSAVVTCTPAPGTAFPIGSNVVQCVAADSAGNRATNFFAIIVNNANPPLISSSALTQASFQFTMSGVPGSQYEIQYKDDLAGTDQWQTLPSFTLSNTIQTINDTNVTSHRFYRAVLLP